MQPPLEKRHQIQIQVHQRPQLAVPYPVALQAAVVQAVVVQVAVVRAAVVQAVPVVEVVPVVATQTI